MFSSLFHLLYLCRRAGHMMIALALVMLVASCDFINSIGSIGKTASKSTKVALLIPAGSTNEGDIILAKNLENAARMAVSENPDAKIDLRVYHTAGTAAGGENAARNALADGAEIIVGPLFSEAAATAAIQAAQKNINVLAFSNNPAIAGSNLYILGHTFENTALRMSSYAKSRGIERIMVAHSQSPQGTAGKTAIVNALNATGITTVGNVAYGFSYEGINHAASTIAKSAKEQNAQALFLTADSSADLPVLADILPQHGISSQTLKFLGLTRWDIPPSIASIAGMQGAWFALPDQDNTRAFSNRYTATYGTQPHPLAGLAYDGIMAVATLAKQGQKPTHKNLTKKSGFQGVNGVFRFLSNGSNQRELAIAEIRNNQIVVIDAAHNSFTGFNLFNF